MITKVTVKNCFSIYEEQIIDFSSKKYDYKNDYLYSLSDEISICNPMAVYGYNGSGKTVVLKVLKYIYDILTYNKSKFLMPRNIPNLNFEDSMSKKSKITFEIIIDNKHVSYEISSIYDKKTYNEVLIVDEDILINELEKNVDDSTELEKIAKSGDKEVISRIYNFFINIMYVDVKGEIFCNNIKESNSILIDNYDKIQSKLEKLKVLPLYNIKEDKEFNSDNSSTQLYIEFESGISARYDQFASNGTRSINKLLSHLNNYPETSLIIIDELEYTLHPIVVRNFIKNFKEDYPDKQLIFSTHNTNILQQLRPDQILFTFNNMMQTTIRRACDFDFKIREGHNMEKLYYSGAFDYDIE